MLTFLIHFSDANSTRGHDLSSPINNKFYATPIEIPAGRFRKVDKFDLCGMSKGHEWLGLGLLRLLSHVAHVENARCWTHTVLQVEASG